MSAEANIEWRVTFFCKCPHRVGVCVSEWVGGSLCDFSVDEGTEIYLKVGLEILVNHFTHLLCHS